MGDNVADRSVKVVVRADVQPLKAAMADGARSVQGLTAKTETLGQRLKSRAQFLGMTAGVLSLGAAIKGTFSLGLDFTTQLNTMQAVTGATGDQMARVSQLAKDLGNDISIPGASASDAAQAMTELAKGGLSVDQAMQAAKGTLQLAAAAQVSGAQAATIQANALNTFGLKADQAGHVADVLANTANAASGDITDFAQGMQQAGGVANLFGVSLDDTATVLGIFAKAGVIGSDAGTSLKTALTQLATPSKNAQQAMDALNLTVYDGKGQFVGMRSLTDQLSKAQGRMSQQAFQSAAGILFGNDAIRAAAFLAKSGTRGYDEMRTAVEKAGGAAELAAAKMKGLPGALQNMQNAAENVALSLYQTLAPAVESVINGLSDAINTVGPIVVGTLGTIFHVVGGLAGAFSSLPGPIKTFAVALAAVAIANKIGLFDRLSSAVGGVGRAFTGLRGVWSRIGDDAALAGVSRMRVGLGLVGSAAKKAGSSVVSAFGGPWGVALAGATVGLQIITGWFEDAAPKVTDFTAAIDTNTGALAANAQATAAKALSDSGAFDKIKAAGIDTRDYTLAVLGNKDALGRVNKELGQFIKANNGNTDAMFAAAQAATQLQSDTGQLADAQSNATDVIHASAEATADNAAATTKQGQALIDMRPEQDRYVTSLIATRDAALSSEAVLDAMSGRVRATANQFNFAHDSAFKFADSIDSVKTAMDRMAGRAPDVEEATRRFNGALQQAIESAKDANGNIIALGNGIIKASGQIDTGTKKGQDLYDTVTDLASAARDNALAMAKQAGATGGVTAAADAAGKALQNSRQDFIDNAAQMGLTKDQAKKLADAYFGLPSEIKVQVYGVSDFADVDAKIQHLADTTIIAPVRGVYTGTDGAPSFAYASVGRASGGWVFGGGTGTSDSINARLSNGEFVVNAKASKEHGPLLEAINRSGLPGYANGGQVGAPVGNSTGGMRFVIPQSAQQPIVRQVTYQIYAVPGESVDSLVSKVDRRSMFYERV